MRHRAGPYETGPIACLPVLGLVPLSQARVPAHCAAGEKLRQVLDCYHRGLQFHLPFMAACSNGHALWCTVKFTPQSPPCTHPSSSPPFHPPPLPSPLQSPSCRRRLPTLASSRRWTTTRGGPWGQQAGERRRALACWAPRATWTPNTTSHARSPRRVTSTGVFTVACSKHLASTAGAD